MDTVDPLTFQSMSKGVVERFLQTVVVLDDGAYMEPATTPQAIVEPDEDVPILDEEPEVSRESTTPLETKVNALDAQTLITGFAKQGLVCAVLAPRIDEDGAEATVKASRRADIVILDWQLGDHGERATKIIGKIVEEDVSVGGRVRMIVVYTASLDLEAARIAIAGKLTEFKAIDRAGGVLGLGTRHSRVLFISKGQTSAFAGRIEEADLPLRLVEEFVEMTKGILSNVTLGCIAAIREETHRILARFHRGLDSAFLTHRMLLISPDDAEAYAVDLLAAEFLAALEGREIGSIHAGRGAIEAALVELQEGGIKFRIMVARNAATSAKSVTAEQLMNLVDKGPEGLVDIPGLPSGQGPRDKLHERLYLLVSEHVNDGLAANREFSRVSAHARERALQGPKHRAKLDLGSIVRLGEEFLVCVQPTCDTLRLRGPTQFVFAELSEDEEEFDVVVKDLDDSEKCLRLNSKASAIRTAIFKPVADTGLVLATLGGGEFSCNLGNRYSWLCDLKTSFAQRFVHRIAMDLSRVGLEEFEWQRRHAPST